MMGSQWVMEISTGNGIPMGDGVPVGDGGPQWMTETSMGDGVPMVGHSNGIVGFHWVMGAQRIMESQWVMGS